MLDDVLRGQFAHQQAHDDSAQAQGRRQHHPVRAQIRRPLPDARRRNQAEQDDCGPDQEDDSLEQAEIQEMITDEVIDQHGGNAHTAHGNEG